MLAHPAVEPFCISTPEKPTTYAVIITEMSTNCQIDPKVVFEDNSFLVLDKPSGWITNDASTTTTQPVVQTWLRENLKYLLVGDRERRDGIVHRLDKETSGLLVIAKTVSAFEDLQSQFKERKVTKTYIALAHGEIIPVEGKIEASVGRLPWRRQRFGVLPGGREATTNYKVIKTLSNDTEKFSLVELYPKTGRTHQIRIHLKFIGHPIVGDNFYAGRKTSRDDRVWCPRLFLHASKITFFHPETKKELNFESNLPEDLEKVLKQLS